MVSSEPVEAGAAALAEAKAYLRIGFGEEDELVARIVASAVDLCEQFTGQVVLARSFRETLAASGAWTRLARVPVRAISTVEAMKDGVATAMSASNYSIDIDAAGHGWVRLMAPQAARTIRVGYSAGLADDWDGMAEPLRQGIVRLAAHLYTHRNAPDDAGPPAVVSALWRPYRRMRLG